MFTQNSKKKQTTLSFARKSMPGSKHPSATTKVRSTPYTRPISQPTTSQYFSKNTPSHARSQPTGSSRMYKSDSFGSEISAMIHSSQGTGAVQYGGIPSGSLRPSAAVKLSAKQLEAFDMAVNQRSSVFITGSAGTGKSVLMREIIDAFQTQLLMGDNEVQVTASTGIAAFHIGGRTIHSFAGVGYGKGTPQSLLNFVQKSRRALMRWHKVKILIIDEISMLDAGLFDGLEFIARKVRKSEAFFGGIQLVITGDFYQLPPVDRSSQANFAFDGQAWKQGVENTVVLTHVFRQKDMRFVDMLNEMRLGKLSDQTLAQFRALARKPNYPADGIEATELYALRAQVDTANSRRLQSLAGRKLIFNSVDNHIQKGKETMLVDEETRKKIDAVVMVPRTLEVKIGAQVMLVKNMPEQNLVNGSRGVVTGFEMVGVREYPVVRFTTGAKLTIVPEASEVEAAGGRFRRTQLPLILAWALSIHKSQGQTIDRVLVDLGKIFEKGQAYVALSRAIGLESLQVLNFRPECIMAHPRVVQYYAELSRKL